MNTPHPHDLVIGLDRSDKKADLCLITPATGQRTSQTIDTAPEALWEWLLALRQEQPQARVALCLEQPAVHLISFLEAYEWITLYPVNPITLQKYREAFITSRAKDDAQDADYLADLLLTHHAKLKPWAPEDSPTRAVQQRVLHRRAVVDERTALTNRLIALLKQYFPQALVLCGDDLWRPLATRFLLKWSSLQAVQKAKPATVKQFYHLHGSRSARLLEQRLALVAKAVPVTDETALIESFALRVQLICRQLQLVTRTIADYNQQIAQAYAAHPDREIFASLPGAGAVLGPRLLASLGSQRERFGAAADLQRYTGIAPVTKRSGALVTFTGGICVPSSTSRAFTSMPREAFCRAAGRRLTTCNNGPKAVRIRRRCGRWPTNGSGSSSAAGRIARPIGRKFTKPLSERTAARLLPCLTGWNWAKVPSKTR